MMSFLHDLLGLAPPDFIYVTDASAPRLAAANVADALSSLEDTATAFVNAIACFTPRIFYDTVLNALADWHVSWESGCENWSGRKENQRWNDKLDGFLHGLKELAEQRKPTRIIIAVERAERLNGNLPELIVPLTRLAELTQLPVTTLFISCVAWEDIRPSLGASPDPFHIDAQEFSKQVVIDKLTASFLATSQSHPDNLAYNRALLPLYEHFAALLYSTCALFTHDPDELAYISAARWPGFVQPVLDQHAQSGENELSPPSEDTRMRLFRYFSPSLTAALEQLYPRLVDAELWAQNNAPPPNLLSQPPGTLQPTTAVTLSSESSSPLPRIAKFILLAAFLASTNPAKSDVRMFSRATDERRRRKRNASPRKTKAGQAKVPQRLLGPTPFPLDRLLAILAVLLREYESDENGPTLTEDHAQSEATRFHVYATVTELADMRLLHRTGTAGNLDGTVPSLRCGISHEMALGLARELGVPLNDLMWDPT